MNQMQQILAVSLAGALVPLAVTSAQSTPPTPPPDIHEQPARPTQPVGDPQERILSGWSAHPLGARASSITLPENTIHLYQDAEFKDDLRTIENVTSQSPGTPRTLPGMMEDSMTALRWNLSPGVVVILYEDDGGKGEQLALWGNGEMPSVSRWDFNDKASSWAWYYAGAAAAPSRELEQAAIVYPTGTVIIARDIPVITRGTMNLYKDKNFEGDLSPLVDVTSHPAGALHRLPDGANDNLTSLRWNLPPGVVVMFHQDAAGTKQQAAVWGNGQVANVDDWDFNDKISRWSWHYIGARDVEVLGYVPQPETIVVVPVVTGALRDSVDVVAKSIEANRLGIVADDLTAMRNPTGEGTFVYVPRTRFEGVDRHVIWIVVDDRAYAVTGPAKMVTPTVPTASEAESAIWARTGINKSDAETDAVRIVFPTK